jgi:hypothetical protein
MTVSEKRQCSICVSERILIWNYLIDTFLIAPCKAGITVSTGSCLSV